jgi:hypothetical protein
MARQSSFFILGQNVSNVKDSTETNRNKKITTIVIDKNTEFIDGITI